MSLLLGGEGGGGGGGLMRGIKIPQQDFALKRQGGGGGLMREGGVFAGHHGNNILEGNHYISGVLLWSLLSVALK